MMYLLDCPALVWDKSNSINCCSNQNDDDDDDDDTTTTTTIDDDPYWDTKGIIIPDDWLMMKMREGGKEGERDYNDEGDDRCYLTYRSLFIATALLVRKLRIMIGEKISISQQHHLHRQQQQQEQRQSPHNNHLNSIPVAVAVPEGMWLPIAVTAVHVLNFPANWTLPNQQQQQQQISAVLVPIDPTDDATFRIQHMIDTCRPAIILTASECDCRTMQNVVDKIHQQQANDGQEEQEEDSFSPSSLLYRSSTIDVVNVRSLFRSDDGDVMTVLAAAAAEQKVDQNMKMQQPPQQPHLLHEWILEFERAMFRNDDDDDGGGNNPNNNNINRVSHVVFTSGTTGIPKGCVSSIQSLQHYVQCKNRTHNISNSSKVLLASSVSFDPCLGDILSCFTANATLVIVKRQQLVTNLLSVLQSYKITHCLCTPSLWNTITLPGSSSSTTTTPLLRDNNIVFPRLQVIALGGEPIPTSIVRTWARRRRRRMAKKKNISNGDGYCSTREDGDVDDTAYPRLYATYGVTEACIYQTIGEVFYDIYDEDGEGLGSCSDNNAIRKTNLGQDVGLPFDGIGVRICRCCLDETTTETTKETTNQNSNQLLYGEVVLYGKQIDMYSSYLNQPDLSRDKFIRNCNCCGGDDYRYYYRTGDKGCIDSNSGHLHIAGRIGGDGSEMIKINGVRIEIGEVEAAIKDDDNNEEDYPVVADCIVTPVRGSSNDNNDDNGENDINKNNSVTVQSLIAYVVLSAECLIQEQQVTAEHNNIPTNGIICTGGPLLILLRERTKMKSRVVPSVFVLLPRIPLSSTGKRNRRGVPPLNDCVVPFSSTSRSDMIIPLNEYGHTGSIVSEIVIDCLNLQPVQVQTMLTTNATFGMLGGDSLAATRVVRALYAKHHQIHDSRYLGGKYGVLDGKPFDVVHLLSCKNLGQYVDFLDANHVCASSLVSTETVEPANSSSATSNGSTNNSGSPSSEKSNLYDALLQATSQGSTNIALGLLRAGADPNFSDEHSDSNQRLGKLRGGRTARRRTFKSTPLHLACMRGDVPLVRQLLTNKARYNIPDASGLFPVHLACGSRSNDDDDVAKDEKNRIECMKLLLDYAGAPLPMKDGSKQTVLHAAARSGRCHLLRYLLRRWFDAYSSDPRMMDSMNWRDSWARTAVHWAVLNGYVDALAVLVLEFKCDPRPIKLNNVKSSSAASETPVEICERLYGGRSSDIGNRILDILLSSAEW